MFKVCTAISTLLLFLFVTSLSVMASENVLMTIEELQRVGFDQYESVNPDSLVYPIKRLGEKVKSIFISDQNNKAKNSYNLLNVRFKELVYTINFQKSGFLTEVINRHNTSVGQIKLNYPKTKNKDIILKNLKVLEVLRDRFPANSAHWLNVQQAVDTTKSLL